MKSLITLVTLLGICAAQQCEDTGGTELCLSILKGKNGLCVQLTAVELSNCRKTCKACIASSSSSNDKPPSWAYPVPTQRPPKRRPNNPAQSSEDDPLQLPLYAVILIVVAVILIFIGCTVCVIKMKKKWKKRRMRKNRAMLQNAPPAPNTLHPNYLWAQAGSYNGAYYPEVDDWSKNGYLIPGDVNQDKTLNNSGAVTHENPNAKNLEVIKNTAKEKRRAPEPPAESPYQNLSSNPPNGNKPKSKAPAPPPAQEPGKKEVPEIVEIPINCTESVFSVENTLERDKKQTKTPGNEYNSPDSWDGPKTLPTRLPVESPKKSPRKRRKRKQGRRSREKRHNASDSDSSSSEETQKPPAIVKILNEWKEHLLEQKKELEDYHKNLANYVQNLNMRKANENEKEQRHNEQMENWLKSNKSDRPLNGAREQNFSQASERQYASIPMDYQLNFPEPPESIRGDFTWEPNDAKGQKQVIMDLKKKISRLQNLLESTQDAAESDRKSNDWYMMDKVEREPKYQSTSEILGEDKITIKTLLQRLEGRECTKVQLRIAQALDNSKKRGKMNIESRDGPITCLSKQIHHVMTDILDPRTSTKIDLGAHAACTLANKLLKSVHANLLPVLRAKNPRRGVEKTTERISQLCKQLLDMTQQLMNRQSSFDLKDYNVFVNAYVDAMQKVMDATYQLVNIILDLQRAERHGLMQESRPQSEHYQSVPPQSYQPSVADQRRQIQEKQHLLSRLHSESNATSLSVADVRQLHEDLGKLRQLLNTDTTVPSLSGVGTNPQVFYGDTGQDFKSEFEYTVNGAECDVLSTMSCSTCMPIGPDPMYYDRTPETEPQLKASKENIPIPNTGVNPANRVQYTEVLLPNEEPKEYYRPATRPPKQGGSLTLPVEASERPIHPNKPTDPNTGGQADNPKVHTLDPSSFSSFRSENENLNGAQRRHRAMLARYFDKEDIAPMGEPHQSGPSSRPPKNKNAQTMPGYSLHPENPEVPMITMLPCGMVANDTPPIRNPPKEKLKLPKIPEITVVRNGTEEVTSYPSDNNEEYSETKWEGNGRVNDDTRKEVAGENLNDSYHSTDTLPLKEVEIIPEVSETETEIELPIVSDSEETSPKVPCSVDDDCELFYDKEVLSDLTNNIESFDNLNDEDHAANDPGPDSFGTAKPVSDSETNSDSLGNISAIEVGPPRDENQSDKENSSESEEDSASSESDSPEIDYNFGGGEFVEYPTNPRNNEINTPGVDVSESHQPSDEETTENDLKNAPIQKKKTDSVEPDAELITDDQINPKLDIIPSKEANEKPLTRTDELGNSNHASCENPNEEASGVDAEENKEDNKEYSSDENAFDEKSRALLGDFPLNSLNKEEEKGSGNKSPKGKSSSKGCLILK